MPTIWKIIGISILQPGNTMRSLISGLRVALQVINILPFIVAQDGGVVKHGLMHGLWAGHTFLFMTGDGSNGAMILIILMKQEYQGMKNIKLKLTINNQE